MVRTGSVIEGTGDMTGIPGIDTTGNWLTDANYLAKGYQVITKNTAGEYEVLEGTALFVEPGDAGQDDGSKLYTFPPGSDVEEDTSTYLINAEECMVKVWDLPDDVFTNTATPLATAAEIAKGYTAFGKISDEKYGIITRHSY